ncbi:transmembrane protein 164 [Biomphalaria glabrata]|uniref:Transmembrane protein 164-like n=1 Tax=Biomphalaria glabrata TaxID=6526 RepID=A0A9W2Z0G5_BIOGL|nr:transmembrane protein 164-like [Biomphalaria glabrata]XP_055868437.1 transmembrane protein 164-like [Biomphalaria glabrata]XP_055868438.1 transmembrane protein 164-like [Biomphalaria glabrata]XP_055868439.1 transmembrane protein 164-like [Biomphalaria glabrata]KAI8750984.1 transmembrane protein 164-like [Biomphalaria glabrata]KAI8772294.1 transmembrane protein 164 [Biomphalaria glabrata]
MANLDHNNEGWFDWAYKGVDHSFPGNGGIACRDFLSFSQRCWESLGASAVALIALAIAYPRLRLPRPCPCAYRHRADPLGKRLLLLLMCLTFGIELGFKFATRQMIWIGNPCHLATMLQIFMLAAPPSRIVTAAFRLHMHMLTGAPIAILFPVINTRLLPFETSVYFLQHFLMLIIPFYLMSLGDPYIPERLNDFSWSMVAFGLLFLYHFIPLQMLAYVSHVNLNNMLCPAVSDPFHGKFYRLFAMVHQIILIPTLGKLLVILAKAINILPCDNPPDECFLSYAWNCETKCCDYSTCSSNATTENSCQDTGDTSELDSGVLSSGCNYKLRCDPCSQKSSGLYPRLKCCFYCCDHANHQFNCSCSINESKDVGSVMHIVNGKIIGEVSRKDSDKEKGLRKRESDAGPHKSQERDTHLEQHGPPDSVQGSLTDPDPGTEEEKHINKTLHLPESSDKRNGHTKSH